MRITAKAVTDDRREARKAMLDANPNLRAMYSEDDGVCVVMYLEDAQVVLSSFTSDSEDWSF